jgi:hypothetical protein
MKPLWLSNGSFALSNAEATDIQLKNIQESSEVDTSISKVRNYKRHMKDLRFSWQWL